MMLALLIMTAITTAAAVHPEPVPLQEVLEEYWELGLENRTPVVCTGRSGDSLPAIYSCSLSQTGNGHILFLDSGAPGLEALLVHRGATGEPVITGFEAGGPYGWWLWEFLGLTVGDEDGDGFEDLRVKASWITGMGCDGAVPFETESVLLWDPENGVFSFSEEMSGL